jgi:hypothetical protein
MVALFFVIAIVPLEVRAQPADGRRGWLGFAGEDPASGVGVVIVEVLPGSPAAVAGLRAGDQVSAVNGRPVASYRELARRVSVLSPGTTLRFSVRRGNRFRDVVVTLGEPPASLPNRSRSTGRGRPAAPAMGSTQPRSSGSGQWHCRAVGTYVRGTPNGGPDYSDKQNIDVTKWGATRDAAGIAAINECSSMLNLETVSLPNSGALVLEYCRAISCSR